jgi:FKBP-type peptidyl-prolyl cis-trans isomerase
MQIKRQRFLLSALAMTLTTALAWSDDSKKSETENSLADAMSAKLSSTVTVSEAENQVEEKITNGSDKFGSDKERFSYFLGVDLGRSMEQLNSLYEIDQDIAIAGFTEALKGNKLKLSDDELSVVALEFEQAFQEASLKKIAEDQAKAKAESEAFLAKNAKKDGVTVTDSGLQYEVLKEGKGDKPAANAQVEVDYVGTLLNGTQFDSSIERGKRAKFGLNQVIAGWTEGLQLMNKGSKFKFYVPAELGYGERGIPQGDIPGNSVLVFEVELYDFTNEETEEKKAE